MMGLAKIAPDGWAYYAREIAAGVEDYFVGHGEETGRWVGRAAEALGLSGEVDSEGLSRLFGQGLQPVTGVPLGRSYPPDDKAAVAGYALSFSPKSAAVGLPPERWLGGDLERRSATKRELAMARMGVKPSFELVLAEAIDRLERSHSTWGRAQAVEVLSVVLPAHKSQTAGQVRQALEAAADMLLAHPDVVGLPGPARRPPRQPPLQHLVDPTDRTSRPRRHRAGRTAGVAVVPTEQVLADAGLGEDQKHAVRRVCGGGERVAVLIGPAGSGKSRTLRAARQAWEQAGIQVRGVAPSAVAAGVLTEQAGISSDTLARFLVEVANRRTTLNPGEVIVCDEASMVSTRDLARLVLLADTAGAKVVLVGDHYQLGSVDAGGLFRLLAADAKTAELTSVRRFTDPWEAQASRRLRHGDPSVIGEYTRRGRVRSGDRDRVLEEAHHTWKQARDHGHSVVVMAADRDTVNQLAMRARANRVQTGEVEAGGITVGTQTVGVGDEIVTTRNDRRLVTTTGAWVRNVTAGASTSATKTAPCSSVPSTGGGL